MLDLWRTTAGRLEYSQVAPVVGQVAQSVFPMGCVERRRRGGMEIRGRAGKER